jgi:DNA-binding MarR family transcriptional regulator
MPVEYPTAYDVMFNIVTLGHELQRHFDQGLAGRPMPLDVSGTQTRVLFVVSKAGQIRMTDLAVELGITPRTLTTVVTSLEKKGYIHRFVDSNDKRAVLVEITDVVKQGIEQARSLQKEQSEVLFEALTDEQRKELFELLNLVRKKLGV